MAGKPNDIIAFDAVAELVARGMSTDAGGAHVKVDRQTARRLAHVAGVQVFADSVVVEVVQTRVVDGISASDVHRLVAEAKRRLDES